MRYQVNAGPVISEVIDGEAVIINLTTGNYYSLNGTGAAVWNEIERAAGADEIVARLASRYETAPEAIEPEVERILAELASEDLIVAADGSVPASAPVETAGGAQPFEPPRLEKHTDMQDLILLDPVHEVGEQGWPHTKDQAASA